MLLTTGDVKRWCYILKKDLKLNLSIMMMIDDENTLSYLAQRFVLYDVGIQKIIDDSISTFKGV